MSKIVLDQKVMRNYGALSAVIFALGPDVDMIISIEETDTNQSINIKYLYGDIHLVTLAVTKDGYEVERVKPMAFKSYPVGNGRPKKETCVAVMEYISMVIKNFIILQGIDPPPL